MSHFLTTPPAVQPCPSCGRLVATGHAEGLPYRTDLVPLTLAAELRARNEGLRVWQLVGDGRFAYRSARLVKATPHAPVFAQHRCKRVPGPDDVHRGFIAAAANLAAKYTAPNGEPAPADEAERRAVGLFVAELDARVVAVGVVAESNTDVARQARADRTRGHRVRERGEADQAQEPIPF
ncbi:hypothetical protein [Saccharopolyspora hattusasensis]|uniref:hypothetical protein n=1 Tax=Saccharopolyspora hattusasensis TaxID=1128679 RepID=UPI003D964FD1